MFTENQSRQLYVINSNVVAPFVAGSGTNSNVPTDASSAGAMQLVTSDDECYFIYKGPSDDGLQRTDTIKKCNIKSITCTAAADLKHTNKKAIITLDSSLVSSSNLVAGGDYVMHIEFRNYIASGYDSTKIKFAAVRAAAGSSASDLYKKLALNLAKNLSREAVPLVNVYLCKTDLTSATSTSAKFISVTSKTAASSLTDTYLGICIEEATQPWRRGAAPVEYVDFVISPSTVYYNSADVVWGKVQFYGSATYTDGTSSAVTIGAPNTQVNSRNAADMEYFFHKNRGDVYGEVGFPNNIDTTYMVESGNTYGYSFVDIHYYYEGNSHNVGHSEKTLTIVCAGKASTPQQYLKTLIGSAATTGQTPTAATGLYAFIEGTNVTIKTSSNW